MISPELIRKYIERQPLDPIDVVVIENDLCIEPPHSFYPEVNDRIHFMMVLDDVMNQINEAEHKIKEL